MLRFYRLQFVVFALAAMSSCSGGGKSEGQESASAVESSYSDENDNYVVKEESSFDAEDVDNARDEMELVVLEAFEHRWDGKLADYLTPSLAEEADQGEPWIDIFGLDLDVGCDDANAMILSCDTKDKIVVMGCPCTTYEEAEGPTIYLYCKWRFDLVKEGNDYKISSIELLSVEER